MFAPTDEAFVEALDTLGVTSAQLLAAPELLQAVCWRRRAAGRGGAPCGGKCSGASYPPLCLWPTLRCPPHPAALPQILKYHVVPGESLTAGQLSTGDKLPTLLAADIANAAAAQPAAAWHEKGSSQDKGETGELTINVQQVGWVAGWLAEVPPQLPVAAASTRPPAALRRSTRCTPSPPAAASWWWARCRRPPWWCPTSTPAAPPSCTLWMPCCCPTWPPRPRRRPRRAACGAACSSCGACELPRLSLLAP